MDFKTRELRFGLSDRSKFDAQEVTCALKSEGFADAEVTSAPGRAWAQICVVQRAELCG